jgi:hypothetical protein
VLAEVERVVIVFDDERGREELVWSFEPRDPTVASAQILPLPAKPDVVELPEDALEALVDRYPTFPSSGVVPGASSAKPAPTAAAPRKQLTWSTHGPDELESLRERLAERGHPVDAGTHAWLAELATRGFHFVVVQRPARAPSAKRTAGDASSDATKPPRPALLRLSFSTPAPYLPYAEPPAPKDAGRGRGRSLVVWLVSRAARSPLATYTEAGVHRYVRPLRETSAEEVDASSLAKAAGRSVGGLLPQKTERLWVQRFVDQKSLRDGFGDVVFVPRAPLPAPLDPAKAAPIAGALAPGAEGPR